MLLYKHQFVHNELVVNNIICLGYFNKWNSSLARKSNIWTVLRQMKDEQRRAVRLIRFSDRGQEVHMRRRKWRNLEAKITRLRKQYERGTMSLQNYWDAISHVIHN